MAVEEARAPSTAGSGPGGSSSTKSRKSPWPRLGRCVAVQRHPVRLCLVAPRDRVREAGVSASCTATIASRRAAPSPGLRKPAAPAPSRRPPRPGTATRKSVPQAIPFQRVIAREVRELVRGDEAHLSSREAAVQQRVPEDDALARPDPDRVGIRRGRLVADVLLDGSAGRRRPRCAPAARSARRASGRGADACRS